MSRLFSIALLALAITACGDNKNNNNPDGGTPIDSGQPDSAIDAGSGSGSGSDMGSGSGSDMGSGSGSDMGSGSGSDMGSDDPSGITQAVATGSGSGLDLPITNATVTYLKPAYGTSDPAGFTIQAVQTGPGLFVTVDPASLGLTPALAVGDVVSFDITAMKLTGDEPRATAIGTVTRSGSGSDVSLLARDVSAATDLVTNVAGYDSTIVSFNGTFASDFASSSSDGSLVSTQLTTAGFATPDPTLTFRVPAALVSSLGMGSACTVTATNIPVGRYYEDAEIGAFDGSDFSVSCPAFFIEGVAAADPNTVTITFNLPLGSGVGSDGSQFTITGSDGSTLAVTGASVDGRTITLTTDDQTAALLYSLGIGSGIADVQGSDFVPPGTAPTFTGYQQLVVLNEVDAAIGSGCDLVEMRTLVAGSLAGYKLAVRGGTIVTFPAGFTVPADALVLVHFAGGSAACNPNGATTETLTPMDQPGSTYAGNYDTAYDFWTTTTSDMVATNNVVSVLDPSGDVVDTVFFGTSGSVASATVTAANTAGSGQWIDGTWPITAGNFLSAAVNPTGWSTSSGSGTSSLRRTSNTDTNAKADWTVGSSSWGMLNENEGSGLGPVHVLAHRR